MLLEGKNALVTGGSRGLGRAIALRLAREGARVGINYFTQAQQAESVVAEIESGGGAAMALQADIADDGQVRAMVEQFGGADVLVNNAGIMVNGDLADFDYSQMERMRRTNVDGLVNVTRAVVERMKQRRFGRIVNLASVAGTGTAMAGTTFYAATKAAVALLTRRFAMELGPAGITVNAIAPGFIVTDMTRRAGEEKLRTIVESVSAKAMVRRAGQPEDIANAVAFLVSPASGFVTAQILTVDGGRMDYIGHF